MKRIREKLGPAGFVIAVVALVAALGGGAYAASGGLSGKQKKEVEKIAKKFAGKPGATGPKGDAGAPGAKGDAGPQGKEGSPGKEGTQGKEGSPWTAGGVLPSGKTETGTWWFQSNGGGAQAAPISWPIPLSAADAESITEVLISTEAAPEEECPGTLAEPKAKPGVLCLYMSEESTVPNPVGIYQPDYETQVGVGGIGTSGILLAYETLPNSSIAGGSFAVTAP